MKMKMIMTVAAVAVATVAGASTNYVERAVKRGNLVQTVSEMSRDGNLADPAAFRTALEAFDKAAATGKVGVALQKLSRRCPLTVRAVLGRRTDLGEKVRAAMLARCGYDAPNKSVEPTPDETEYVDYRLQLAGAGRIAPGGVRSAVLSAAIRPTRRWIRAQGDSFVGKEGAKRVKGVLDALAAELNAPRFGKAGEILSKLGVEVEWEAVQSRIPSDAEVAEIKALILDGAIPFTPELQNRLCVALGVDGYNAFVREYNGNGKKCRVGAAKAEPHVDAVPAAVTAKMSEPGRIGNVREAAEGDLCSLAGMYSRRCLLSGPWSAMRRLEAARLRGDAREEERAKALLDELVRKALEDEES